VASAGGGRSGFRLLKEVLKAHHLLRESIPIRLEVFTGPFVADDEFSKLQALAATGTRIRKFTNRFLDYLYAADLSISLAGYNTCMNLLVTKVPALVCPYSRQREQPLRVEKIKNFIPMQIISDTDLNPVSLCAHIKQMLSQTRSPDPIPIDLAGAQHAAAFLEKWVLDPIN
jgi:predicted glycosyltransferase